MAGSPTDALFTRENMIDLQNAIHTKGVANIELLAYVVLLAADMILAKAIEEIDRGKK